MSNALSCDQPWPDNIDLCLKLMPTKSEKVFLQRPAADATALDCRVTITDAWITVPRMTLKKKIPHPIKYKCEYWRLLTFNMANTQQTFGPVSIASGKLPNRACIFFMGESRYDGNYEKNSVKPETLDVKTVKMTVNQRTLPTLSGINTDWSKDDYMQAFMSMYEGGLQSNNLVKYLNFDTTAMYGFDLTPTKNALSFDKSVRGVADLEVTFAKKAAENVVVHALLIYNADYSITADGKFRSETI